MAKGDIKLVNCIGSIGSVVRDFDTKEVIEGSYRHSQTIDGITYTWKCAEKHITGVVKLVEDEYEARTFYRMEGLAKSAADITAVRTARAAIDEMDWGA